MKSSEFITENITDREVNDLNKKGRKKVMDVFNSVSPIKIRSVSRGGVDMGGLVFTFNPNDVKTLDSNQWDSMEQAIVGAFANEGMSASVTQAIWKSNGMLRAKPKVLVEVDIIAKLNRLKYVVTVAPVRSIPMPSGTDELIQQVNSF